MKTINYLLGLLFISLLASCTKEYYTVEGEASSYEYVITDYGADAYGGGDCSGIINKLIEDMPLSGGCIVIPEGTFVLDNPIEINKNYITIKGVNSGMRSNIDVKELDLLIGAGGGSKIVLRNTDCAFHIPVMENVNNSINRISGVEIKDLMISGGEKNNGIGIFIEHDNDRCQISNVIGVNLQKGVEAHKCDALIIKDSWFCEMKSGIELYGGIQNKITDCQLGAQPDGITCLLQGEQNLVFSNNHVYPDGGINLKLVDCEFVNITSNNFKSYYNGIIDIKGNNNLLNGNIIWLVSSDNQTTAKGEDYGVVRVEGTSNFITGNTVKCEWKNIVNPVTFRSVNANGANTFSNLSVADLNSSRVFYVQYGDKIEQCGVTPSNTIYEQVNYRGKIGYLDVDAAGSDDQTASKEWFISQYPQGVIIDPANLGNLNEYSVLWIHIDRNGINSGWENLKTDVFSDDVINALKDYYTNGGNLLLCNHATQLLVPFGRLDAGRAPNLFGAGEGSSNADIWGVNANINRKYDWRQHSIYEGLSTAGAGDHDIYPLIGSGNKEDHNCMWDLNKFEYDDTEDNIKHFESENSASVLGTWQHVVDDACAGLIEFNPAGSINGRCIAIGVAAYEWNQGDTDSNMYRVNIEQLTRNAISYLDSKWKN